MRPLIRLFTTSFPEADESRRSEYAEALRRSVDCPALTRIHLFDEGASYIPGTSEKIVVRKVRNGRPLYSDYFEWINEVVGPEDISVVANADIVLDPHFAVLADTGVPEQTAYALARWDLLANGTPALRDRNDSQDAWVFQGKVRGVRGDFPVGVPRCDNRIAKELELAGYTVKNPSFSLRTYHLHSAPSAKYGVENQPGFVAPPYGYVWPHNLWSLPRTALHNVRFPSNRIGWRLDRRAFGRNLKIHWISRAWRAVAGEPREDEGR